MASPSRRILLVAQLAPPSPLVAARRAEGLTKYLAREGYSVTVLTSAISGDGEIEGADRVVRSTDLMASRLNWRRRSFEALTGESSVTYSKPSRLEAALVPDVAAATWLPFAAGRIPKLLHDERFDCAISTSPAQSAHLLGLILHWREIPWIAEFRDGWLYDRLGSWPFAWQRRFDAALERKVVLGADVVVAVTEPIAEDLRQRFGVPAVVITNGFDPEEPAGGNVDGLLDPRRHSLVYTGRIAYSGLRLGPLVEALRRLRDIDSDGATKLEVVFAGPLTEQEKKEFAAPDLRETVRIAGSLDRPDALALQREADSLLVIANGKREGSVATGKLFEYLGARRPIVVIGDRSPAARIVDEAHAGLTTSGSDPNAIAETLRRLVQEGLPTVSDHTVSQYSYPSLAGRYAELIERVSRR
jgi:glycosyltransferase involved in cell wall biosynthesis